MKAGLLLRLSTGGHDSDGNDRQIAERSTQSGGHHRLPEDFAARIAVVRLVQTAKDTYNRDCL
jgi:hypothetical protein